MPRISYARKMRAVALSMSLPAALPARGFSPSPFAPGAGAVARPVAQRGAAGKRLLSTAGLCSGAGGLPWETLFKNVLVKHIPACVECIRILLNFANNILTAALLILLFYMRHKLELCNTFSVPSVAKVPLPPYPPPVFMLDGSVPPKL
jgi:hypothetical protein